MALYSKKKYMILAKGFRGKNNRCWTLVQNRVNKALSKKQRGRKEMRRTIRRDWKIQVNAGAREHGINYSQTIYALKRSNIGLNRKILSELAQNEPYSFKAVVSELAI